MAQRYVGIDLGSHTVKVVVISSSLRGIAVQASYETRVPGDANDRDPLPAAAAAALSILRERGLTHLPITLALSGGLASYRVLEFPFSDAKRVSQAIGFELDGQFPVPVELLEHDHLVAAKPDGGSQALVVAVQRDILSGVVDTLRDAGLDIRGVTVAGMALAQVAGTVDVSLPPEMSSEPLTPAALLLDMGERTTELIALDSGGTPLAIRSLRKGGRHITRAIQRAYTMDGLQAEQAKHQDAFLIHPGIEASLSEPQRASAEITGRAIAPLMREIEHTQLWLKSEHKVVVREIRLAGGAAKLKGIAEHFGQQLGVPVVLAQPEVKSLTGLETAAEGWTSLSAALGAAMSLAKRPLIQLYDDVEGSGDGSWLFERLGTLATIGVAILAFAAVDTIVKVKTAEKQRDQHLAELETATLAVFGEVLSDGEAVKDKLVSGGSGGVLASVVPERGALEVLDLVAKAAAPQGTPPPNFGGAGAPGATVGGIDPTGAATGATTPNGTPMGTTSTANPIGGVGITTAVGSDGSAQMLDPTGQPIDPSSGQPAGAMGGPLSPVADPDAGILYDDQLIIRTIDIRELKIEIDASATRASAQDRLAGQLEKTGCITNITKGKVRTQNERSVFKMVMDNSCFGGAEETEETEE